MWLLFTHYRPAIHPIIYNATRLFASKAARPRIVNEAIAFPAIRLVAVTGESLGIKTVPEALATFNSSEFELLLVDGNTVPPVARIVSKIPQTVKKPQTIELKKKVLSGKELEFNSTIDSHDLQVKLNRAISFFSKGQTVNITITYRGNRHNTDLRDEIVKSLAAHASPSGTGKQQGKKLIFNMSPLRKPAGK